MSISSITQQFQQFHQAALRMPENSLIQVALRRRERQAWLLPGSKRNGWVYLIYVLALAGAFLVSVSIRRADSWSELSEGLSATGFGLMVGVVAPVAALWLLAGLFRMCRDCLGWYSQIKDSGGTQMLDGLICMSPVNDHDVVLAGIRMYIAPLWPRIIALSFVFCLVSVLAMQLGLQERTLQALWFMPLSVVAMSLCGILGSICLGMYLFLIGLNMRMHLIVPLLSLLIAGLQVLCFSFGGAFFGELSSGSALAFALWPLVLLGLAAGVLLFVATIRVAYGPHGRPTWLLVVLPLLVPVVVGFLFTFASIVSPGQDEESFTALFGNMMWVYNCFMPFSPFSAPTVMLRGVSLADAWLAPGFEFWRWPMLVALQLMLGGLLAETALTATRDRRTALD